MPATKHPTEHPPEKLASTTTPQPPKPPKPATADRCPPAPVSHPIHPGRCRFRRRIRRNSVRESENAGRSSRIRVFWLLAAAVATGGCRNGLFVVYVVTSILYAVFLRAGCVHTLPASPLGSKGARGIGSAGTVTVLVQEPETLFVVVAFFSLIGSVAAAAAFATSQIGTGNTFPRALAFAGTAAAVITDATVTAAALVTAGHGNRIQASSPSSTRPAGFQSTQPIQNRGEGNRSSSTSRASQSLGRIVESGPGETRPSPPLFSFAMFKDVWGVAIAQSWAIIAVVAVAAKAPEIAAVVAAAVAAPLILLRGYQALTGLSPPTALEDRHCPHCPHRSHRSRSPQRPHRHHRSRSPPPLTPLPKPATAHTAPEAPSVPEARHCPPLLPKLPKPATAHTAPRSHRAPIDKPRLDHTRLRHHRHRHRGGRSVPASRNHCNSPRSRSRHHQRKLA